MFGTHVNMSDVDLRKLPHGTYFFCAKCKTWFGKERRGPAQPCPSCGTPWKKAAGLYEKKGDQSKDPPKKPGLAQRMRGFVLLFLALACALCYLTLATRLQRALDRSGDEIRLWLGTLGSILASFLWLAAGTALAFAFLLVSLILFITVGTRLSAPSAAGSGGSQVWQTVRKQGRLVGTAINILASLGALLLLPLVLGRPLDSWDVAIQATIALIAQLLIVPRWDRFLGRLAPAGS
jgi:hypothetical protein